MTQCLSNKEILTTVVMLLTFTVVSSSNNEIHLRIYSNTALAGLPIFDQGVSGLYGNWNATSIFSAEWLGTIEPPETAQYNFSCTFINGYGLLWIDDHMWCHEGMPAYAQQHGPVSMLLTKGKRYLARMQFFHNETNEAKNDYSNHMTSSSSVAVNVYWSNDKSVTNQQPPSYVFSTELPQVVEKRFTLQRELIQRGGWGSWYPHNLLAITRLPDAVQIIIGLCQISTGVCELESVDYGFSLRLGAHAYDNSYVQYYHWFAGSRWDGGVNISVSWSSRIDEFGSKHEDIDELILLIDQVECSNCSNYVAVILLGYAPIWGRTGLISPANTSSATITATPSGLRPTTVHVVGDLYDGSLNITRSHLAIQLEKGSAIGVSTGSTKLNLSQIISMVERAAKAENENYAIYGNLSETKEAVQASVMWLLVFEPYAAGIILTISRGSMGGGDTMCDWDNFFAAMMLGIDAKGKNLAYATFIQQMKYRTVQGFVPNCGSGAKKARDRTEPVVGAKALYELFHRYNETWVIDLLFDDLYAWHDWFWKQRRLPPLNLIALGSDPNPAAIHDPSDWGVNTMQGARWESGMDNSPMYDGPDSSSNNASGPILFDNKLHKMLLYDVGMTANLASDMQRLADMAMVTGRESESKTLTARVKKLAELTQEHLWDDKNNIFINKMPGYAYNLSADTFYRRITPTSFYPLMTGMPTSDQANRMVSDHLLNPNRFCITPADKWPPTLPVISSKDALLQSWKSEHTQDVVLCVDRSNSSVGSCAVFKKRGYHMLRNESIATINQLAEMNALYLYASTDGNDNVVALDNFSSVIGYNKVFDAPVAFVHNIKTREVGMWPLELWYDTKNHHYRVAGSPESNVEVNHGFIRNQTLGYARPLPGACYWGLPSVSFEDNAFATPGGFVYWRGHAWAPLAMLTYWSLNHPAYKDVHSVQIARKGLTNSHHKLFIDTAWRPHHHVCENYAVKHSGGCTGDSFYHWGALGGYMSIIEEGY